MIGPETPTLLELPPNHGCRLKNVTRELVAALCHVDRLFRPYEHNGTWWLRLRTPPEPLTLVAPDYYLFRRVLAMEQLASILEEMDEALDDAEEEEAPNEVNTLHVWGRSFGPENCEPLQ